MCIDGSVIHMELNTLWRSHDDVLLFTRRKSMYKWLFQFSTPYWLQWFLGVNNKTVEGEGNGRLAICFSTRPPNGIDFSLMDNLITKMAVYIIEDLKSLNNILLGMYPCYWRKATTGYNWEWWRCFVIEPLRTKIELLTTLSVANALLGFRILGGQ